METVAWKVDGMTCSTCALSVSKYLEKQGMTQVKVSLADGEVFFDNTKDVAEGQIKKGIEQLGYQVRSGAPGEKLSGGLLSSALQKFWFCLPFTAILMLHMLPGHPAWLMMPWVQFALCLPVFVLGMWYFGKSAIGSLRNGVPNMNVLIAMGAFAAFTYSLVASLMGKGMDNLYYDSAAEIITLVFLGYWMEERSIAATQEAIKSLSSEQKVMATMIAFDHEHQEQLFPVEAKDLRSGDLVLIRTGEHVPADAKILWGSCTVNESIITGESIPVEKNSKDLLIGSSILESGSVKAQVTATGDDSILGKIIKLAKAAQSEKPPIQKLADRISAVFVPTVLAVALLTFFGNYFAGHFPFAEALMRSIAVLVIACPCAMGLATPAAIAVGLGRAAKNGILFKDASSLELFGKIRQIVFDKTGTLTTGKFSIARYLVVEGSDDEFKRCVYSLEKYSNHPIARSITALWKTGNLVKWKKVEEMSGLGVKGIDNEGNEYLAGSYKILQTPPDERHNLYLLKNGILQGWIDVKDEIRPEAKTIIDYFKSKQITTFLLSGDTEEKCAELSKTLGIDKYYAQQSPEAKISVIKSLNDKQPTAMVGDGINDAAALAQAAIGISLSDASALAVHNSQVVLLGQGLRNLPLAMGLGKHTFSTIKGNLFWAFIYNVVAIPIAAFGFLTPGIAALAMGFSDVVLAINSVRLRWKKVI